MPSLARRSSREGRQGPSPRVDESVGDLTATDESGTCGRASACARRVGRLADAVGSPHVCFHEGTLLSTYGADRRLSRDNVS